MSDAIEKITSHVPSVIADAPGLTDFITHTMKGVLSGEYTTQQAEAVGNLAQVGLTAIELQWKIENAKERANERDAAKGELANRGRRRASRSPRSVPDF